jgi:hypothetical protein
MWRAFDRRPRLKAAVVSVVVAGAASGGAQAAARSSDAPPVSLVAKIPPRAGGALAGSEFVEWVRSMKPAQREQAILDEILGGNIPAFLRNLKPIELSCCDASRQPTSLATARVWVMPDYLAIGSDDDFVRFPANFETATAVARRFGFVLPTTAIVDAIYRQAELRLAPQTMTPGPAMTSTAYFQAHDKTIRSQMSGVRPGVLAAGHKKDYVLTRRLAQSPSQEAIYGWHRSTGRPIQPLSLVHGARYADYSHGVRLVSETVFVNGEPRSFYDLIAAPEPARLLSSEGAIAEARELMARNRSASRGTRSSASLRAVTRPALGSPTTRRTALDTP